jgi:hypothetical protein
VFSSVAYLYLLSLIFFDSLYPNHALNNKSELYSYKYQARKARLFPQTSGLSLVYTAKSHLSLDMKSLVVSLIGKKVEVLGPEPSIETHL